MEQRTKFEVELCELINRYSMERETDTPDFILAEYMLTCYRAYYWAVVKNNSWHSETTTNQDGNK